MDHADSRARECAVLSWAGQDWLADPSGALWWPARRSLLLADLHFGKVGHFRRAGVPLPHSAFDKGLRSIDFLVDVYRPDCLIVLGDLFHSYYNREVEYFRAWRRRQKGLEVQLVQGNHDVLKPALMADLGLINMGESLLLGDLELRHDPEPAAEHFAQPPSFRISGHVHPGVKLKGYGRQSLLLPCFCFSAQQALLPAFGTFTGLHRIRPGKGDRVFVLSGQRVIGIGSEQGSV